MFYLFFYSDFFSFARSVNLAGRRIDEATLVKLRKASEELSLPILTVVKKIVSKEAQAIELTEEVEEWIADYIQSLDELKEMVSDGRPPKEIIQEAINVSKYEQTLMEDPTLYADRKNNLEALINTAAEWSTGPETSPLALAVFLEELSLKSSLDEVAPEDAVCLMSLHHGKGLEFTLAFIVGLEEGIFPLEAFKNSKKALEEERRLLYVGMTRTKQILYLTASTCRLKGETKKQMQPSRFLIKELPTKFLERLHTHPNASNWERQFVLTNLSNSTTLT